MRQQKQIAVLSLAFTLTSCATVTALAPLTPDGETEAYAINDRGTVIAGCATDAEGRWRAVMWRNGVPVVLPVPARVSAELGPHTCASDVDGEIVVGTAVEADGTYRPFRYEQDTLVFLAPASTEGVASAVNSGGAHVVGTQSTSFGSQAVLWTIQDGAVITTAIDSLGGPFSLGQGLEKGGYAVGGSNIVSDLPGESHCFIWNGEETIDIGALGRGNCEAFDVMGRRLAPGLWRELYVVGRSSTPDGDLHAFLWHEGTMRDLGTLPGFDGSAAYAVNGAEQIVGTLLRAGRETHAFVYAGGIMQDLNTLVSEPEWVLETARDINRNVEIVGNGTYRGRRRAFLYQRR